MDIPIPVKNTTKYKYILQGQIYYLFENPSKPVKKGEEGFFKPYPDTEVYLNPIRIHSEYEEDHNA